MVQSNVVDLQGNVLRSIDLDDRVFGITPNEAVVHQAVVTQQANARQGTHDTRTRGETAGGGKKPYRQKGTGYARQGTRSDGVFRAARNLDRVHVVTPNGLNLLDVLRLPRLILAESAVTELTRTLTADLATAAPAETHESAASGMSS